MADLSPVETLRAGAEAARGGKRPQGGCWTLGRLGDNLADWLDQEADFLATTIETTYVEDDPASVPEHYLRPLRVARVLLGVPDA